jgi:hypothetical protein
MDTVNFTENGYISDDFAARLQEDRLGQGLLCDAVLKSNDDVEFRVHRVVMVASCPVVFSSLFEVFFIFFANVMKS